MAKLGISTGTVPNDGTGDSLLDGAVKINSNFDEIYTYFGDGTNLSFSGGKWITTAAGIHTLSNVGVGTTNPRFDLEVGAVGASGTSLWVNGDARVTGILTVGTASITLDGSSNRVTVGSGVTIDGNTGIIDVSSITLGGNTLTGVGVTSITAGEGISVDQSTGNVTITTTGGGESYWSQTAAGIHTLSNVGVGTTNPTSALTVKGDTSLETLSVSGVSTLTTTDFTGHITLKAISGNSSLYVLDNNSINVGSSNDLTISHSSIDSVSRIREDGGNLEISANPIKLQHSDSTKLETIGAGVTVTGTTFTNQLSVSGVSTFAGITTVTGTTLFVKQLNTSGISTINELDVTNDISVGTRVEITGFTTITSNGLDVVGVVTAASFRGDASYTASGRWTLGANGTSDYTFTGIGFTQTTNDPLLYLARGRVYEFANNSGGAHPFEIRVSNGGAAYNDGVTNNAAAMGVIRFEIPFSAPNTLYYQCTNHSGMGNTITVYPSI